MGLFLNLTFGQDGLKVPLTQVESEMNTYGAEVSRRAKLILEEQGKNSTGNLSDAIEHEVRTTENGATIVWPMLRAPYWAFVEKGVRGAIDERKAPDSPFKFGSGSGPKGGLKAAIRQWITDKPIGQWRDLQTGRFMSYNSMARRISRNVYLKGIAPTPFLRPTLNELFAQYKRRLERAYAKDVSIAVGTWIDKQQQRLITIKL